MTILDALAKAGVAFVALKESIRVEGKRDIQTKVMTTLFALFAEVERDLISERTREGLARARASGRKLGRPKGVAGRLTARRQGGGDLRRFLELGVSKTAIAKLTGVSRTALVQLHEHPRPPAAALTCISTRMVSVPFYRPRRDRSSLGVGDARRSAPLRSSRASRRDVAAAFGRDLGGQGLADLAGGQVEPRREATGDGTPTRGLPLRGPGRGTGLARQDEPVGGVRPEAAGDGRGGVAGFVEPRPHCEDATAPDPHVEVLHAPPYRQRHAIA